MMTKVNEKLEGKYPWYIGTMNYNGVGLFLTADGRYGKMHYSQADLMDEDTARHALSILNSRLPRKAHMNYYLEGCNEGMIIKEGQVIIGITNKGRRVFWNDEDQEWFDNASSGTQFNSLEDARRVYFTIDKDKSDSQSLTFKRVFIANYDSPVEDTVEDEVVPGDTADEVPSPEADVSEEDTVEITDEEGEEVV